MKALEKAKQVERNQEWSIWEWLGFGGGGSSGTAQG